MNKSIAALRTALVLLLGLMLVAGPAAAQGAGPLPEGADVTLRNTLQDPGEPELPFPALFGLPDDAYDEKGTVSGTASEFPTALAQAGTPMGDITGLYDIDMTAASIEFTMLPDTDDPFWSNVFGEFPDGKFDRYYFTFSEPHNIASGTGDNSSVALRIDSPTVLVVEISAGYAMSPPLSFEITLEAGASSELAVTGVETSMLAVIAMTMILGGAMIFLQARRLD